MFVFISLQMVYSSESRRKNRENGVEQDSEHPLM